MTTPVLPGGWGEMHDALYAWASGIAGAVPVLWEQQSAPAPARPYVSLSVSTPTGDGTFDERRTITEGGGFDVEFSTLEDTSQYYVLVDEHPITVLSEDPPSAADLAAAMAAAIASDEDVSELVTAVAIGGHVQIVPIDPEAGTVVETDDARITLTDLLTEEVRGNRMLTVSVQVLDGDLDTPLAALRSSQALAMALHDSLAGSQVHEALSAAGLALAGREPVQTLPRMGGASWEGRTVFAARFRALSVVRTVGVPWVEIAAAEQTQD